VASEPRAPEAGPAEGRDEARADARRRRLLDAVHDLGVVELDEAGLVVSWNAGAEALTGVPAAAVAGRPPLAIHPPPGDAEDLLAAELLAARTAGRFEGEGWRARADGSLFWAHTVVTALREDGRLLGYGLVFRDLTERKRLEDQQAMVEALRRAEVLKGQFLSTVSHELRTPINAIMGFGSLLGDGVAGPLNERQAAFLAKVLDGAEDLLGRVNDMLELTHVQAGDYAVDAQPLDLAAVAARAIDQLARRPARRDVSVVLRVDGGLGPVLGDDWRLARVFAKLLDNAVRFSPPGGEVEVHLARAGASVRVEVRDAGPGVPRLAMRRIFDPFTQADQSRTRTHGGTGLSLALCKAAVEAHGGAIGVSGAPGGGACFWFTLPGAGSP
jgi:PAS domain S-box-containing protein